MAPHDQRQDQEDPRDATSSPPSTARDEATPGPVAEPDPTAGVDREVGDLDDPDAVEDDGALPGRMGGGLAGG